jgi:hypothetical protein
MIYRGTANGLPYKGRHSKRPAYQKEKILVINYAICIFNYIIWVKKLPKKILIDSTFPNAEFWIKLNLA